MFFYSANLVTQVLRSGDPWSFVPTQTISAQIRGDKEDRQRFYQDPNTEHCFYSPIEPVNPNIRPGKENVPHKLHGFAADYDTKIPVERALEAIAAMKIKPAWMERSLGGNLRLVWVFSAPLLVDDYSFCAFILDAAVKWLQLDLLPALDAQAFKSPSRLLANGCAWTETGHGPIPETALQSFFVAAGRKYRFNPSNAADIPLDVVEKELRVRFPGMNWPGEFTVESQGPTFWIPESTSPLSAIIKPTGIFTFSANALRPFYSWADILGADFVRQFAERTVSKATSDVWWDSKRFWRKIGGTYASAGREELLNFLKVDCSLSSKAEKSGVPPVELALSHIYNQNRIKAAVPFVFRPAGPIEFLGERMLNTYVHRAIPPASHAQAWGPAGSFPFISRMLDNIFDPPDQLPHFLAWFQYYYRCAFNQAPQPGQNIFLMGGVGIGKTFLNRQIVGVAVGGFSDASDHLVDGGAFNSHLMHTPHWCLDDDTPSNSPNAAARMHALFKKTAANQQFLSNEKFQVSGMTEWMGRIGCTTNLDYVSARIIGPMDNSSLDKTCLFRCTPESAIVFPSRPELLRIISTELPFFLRWLLDYQVPDCVIPDPRYGFRSYQEPRLLDQSHQSNAIAPFKELLIESLGEWFAQKPDATEWRGTVSQLVKMMMMNPLNEYVMRSIKLEQSNRYLEQIEKEGVLICATETGPMNTRIWIFANDRKSVHSAPSRLPAPTVVPIFSPTVKPNP